MKKTFLAAVAIMLPFTVSASDLPGKKAAPAPVTTKSAPSFDAFLGGAAGYHYLDCSDCGGISGINGYAVSLRGTFEAPITNQFGFQGDVTLDSVAFPANSLGSNPSFNVTGKSAAVHAFWRDSSVGLIGIIGQKADYTLTDGVLGQTYESYLSANYLGLEGQYFINNVTLYGQVAYLSTSIYGEDIDGYSTNGQIRYFPSRDVKLTLKGNYSEVSNSLGNLSFASIGVRGETRLPNMPVSLFADATYQSLSASVGCNSCITDTKLLVGLNFNFTDQSLFERDRAGASLDPFEGVSALIGL